MSCLDTLVILGSSAPSPSVPSATSKESPKVAHKFAPLPLYELASSEPLEHLGINTIHSKAAAPIAGSNATATVPSIDASKIKSILHHSQGAVAPEAAGTALVTSATSPSKPPHSEHVRFDTVPQVNPSPPHLLHNFGSPR